MSDDLDSFLDGSGEDDGPVHAKLKPAAGRDAQIFQRPMSATFLATMLGMGPRTVQKKLAECPPIGQARSAPLYDFRQALPYLVSPKANDIKAMIKKLGVHELPQSLQKDVWDARLKEQQWRERAGDLWRSEAVMEVFGDTFQALSSTMKLWTDQIAEENDLPNEVRDALMTRVDGLQKMLHERLVQMPGDKVTKSQVSEIENEES